LIQQLSIPVNDSMSLDQQKLYDHASKVHMLLLSPIPEEDKAAQIGNLVVGKLIVIFSDPTEYAQRDSVAITWGAVTTSRAINVPAILLSAGIEFETAYGPAGNRLPTLSNISESDQRVKANPYHQQPICPQYTSFYNGVSLFLLL